MRVFRWLPFALALTAAACDGEPEPLPHLGALPSFSLLDQRGEPYGLEDMRGKVSVVDFVFTHCPTICPTLSQRMSELAGRFADRKGELALVSFSVDPENDTPEVLRQYGARYGSDPAMWTWVTGPTGEVSDTVVHGFKLAMGEPEPFGDGDRYEIMHSAHFVLVDRRGAIRGYYSATDAGEMEKLAADVERLLDEGT